jgi:hypothetical protein
LVIDRRRDADEAGFALVDLLVAVAIAGLAGSILVGLVAFVAHQGAETARRAREHEDLLAVERIMRIILADAPPFLPGAAPLSGIVGHEREVRVTSTGPPILGLPGATVFHLRGEPRGSASAVVLSFRDGEGRERRQVIAETTSDLAFAYLPGRAEPASAVWRSVWRAEDGPLAALRMSLGFGPVSTTRVVIIPIQADLPATCLRDPRQRGCTMGEPGG